MRRWVLVRCGERIAPFFLISVAAYLQARGLTALLRSVVTSAGDLSRGVQTLAPRNAEPKSGRALLANNPFDSSMRVLDARSPTPLAADHSDPLAWPPCEGLEVLIVTESVSDPWWSLTSLRGGGEPSARLRRVGDRVAGKQVAFIGYNPRQQAPTVWLEGGGDSCQSMLFQPSVPGASAVAPQLVARAPTYPRPLIGSVRVVPDEQGGRIVGLRLLGIRPGSLLGQVGLQSGDRLESINGLSLNSPEHGLRAYAQLRTAQRLRVQLSRRGRRVELTLNIN